MRRLLLVFPALIAILMSWDSAIAQTPMKGVYYINPIRTGTNVFHSFAEAVNALAANGVSAPVTISVDANSGPYNEQVYIAPVTGTSAVNTITFEGNGNVLQFVSTIHENSSIVKLDGAHHIIFDSLTVKSHVTNDNEYATAFHLLRDADSNIIRKCTIISQVDPDPTIRTQNSYSIVINGMDDPTGGMAKSDCDYNIITQNTITGGFDGVDIWGSTSSSTGLPEFYVTNNQVTFNTITGFRSNGIQLMVNDNTLIQGNDISGGNDEGTQSAVNVDIGCISTKVVANKIHNLKADPYPGYSVTRRGIFFSQCTPVAGKENLVANNLIYDFDPKVNAYGIIIENGNSYLNIYHNTVSFPTSSSDEIIGVSMNSTNNNFNCLNNIFALGGDAGSIYGIYIGSSTIKNFNFDNNDYYITGTKTLVIGNKGSNYKTLTAWQTATKFDMLSKTLDPLFTDVATANYKPKEAQLDNRGKYVGIDKDIVGVDRDKTFPDLGAYEVASPACTTPVVTGTTSILPGTTVCENTQVFLDLQANSAGTGQTYQWVSSTTETGTYVNVDGALKAPNHTITSSTSLYYKAMVTCGSDTKYSDPVLLTVNPALPAGVYTINAQQPTAGRNFISFADAVQAMHCGVSGPVVFNVVGGSGPYNEQVAIPEIPGASAVNTITFNGNGETLHYLATVKGKPAVIKLSGADYVTIDSLHIIADGSTATQYGIGIQMFNDADYNTISRCIIDIDKVLTTSDRFTGIVINGDTAVIKGFKDPMSDHNMIVNNTINGGQFGISIATNYHPDAAVGNQIIGNKIIDSYASGINAYGADSLVIAGNDISRPTRTNSTTYYGVFYGTSTPHLKIDANRIHDLFKAMPTNTSAAYAISCSSDDGTADAPIVVSNNLVYNFTSNGDQYGLHNSGGDYHLYYHNTISFDDSAYAGTKKTYGIYQTGGATGIEFKNNNITLRRTTNTTSTPSVFCLFLNTSTTAFTADNNNYFIPAKANVNYLVRYQGAGGPQYNTLSDWQGVLGQDAHSYTLDPGYADPINGNFKPTVAALMSKGTGVGVVRDITGVRRNTTTPDIGAYEFGCGTFPVVALDPDSIAVCASSTATFNVKNPTAGVIYEWYNTTSIFADPLTKATQFTTAPITDPTLYYVEAVSQNGCGSAIRVRAKAIALEKLKDAPVVKTERVTAETATFTWAAVPGASGYLVSRDYVNFTTPTAPLSHTVTGLKGGDTLSLVVKATGILECQAIVSDSAFARTLTYTFFVPNMFTPNGDGKNDIFRVYGNTVRSLRLMVFNQWGEKVYEGTDMQQGWNGIYKGQPQPVGVYIYIAQMTFTNGSVQTSKGSLSLIR